LTQPEEPTDPPVDPPVEPPPLPAPVQMVFKCRDCGAQPLTMGVTWKHPKKADDLDHTAFPVQVPQS
jgi:hypothetical protein